MIPVRETGWIYDPLTVVDTLQRPPYNRFSTLDKHLGNKNHRLDAENIRHRFCSVTRKSCL